MPVGRNSEHVNIDEVEAYIQSALARAEDLFQAVHSLPNVDEQGDSECPFAEELYAKKEECQKEVQGCLSRLQGHLSAVEEAIARINGDQELVSAHGAQLHGDRAKGHFSQAEGELGALCKRYEKLRDRIEETIERIEEILAEAATKQFPGRQPRRWPGGGGKGPNPPGEPTGQGPGGSGADQELEALFELDKQRISDRGRQEDRVLPREAREDRHYE